MKSNEELNKKYNQFFNEPVTDSKLETQLDLIPSVSESIAWGQERPKKTIMTEEEFDKIFGSLE
jgi:hypothetical protein